jgi:hypothetical protein
MNEERFARMLHDRLEENLDEIPVADVRRLAAARRYALAHRKTGHSAQAQRDSGGRLSLLLGTYARPLLASALLLVVVGGIAYWNNQTQIQAVADLDSEILADDIPLDALHDKEFGKWLEASSQSQP